MVGWDFGNLQYDEGPGRIGKGWVKRMVCGLLIPECRCLILPRKRVDVSSHVGRGARRDPVPQTWYGCM